MSSSESRSSSSTGVSVLVLTTLAQMASPYFCRSSFSISGASISARTTTGLPGCAGSCTCQTGAGIGTLTPDPTSCPGLAGSSSSQRYFTSVAFLDSPTPKCSQPLPR